MNRQPQNDAATSTAQPEAPPRSDDTSWYKDAIIYQAHVKAFGDSNGDGIGDFRGLTDRLGYIRDLGVTAIWILPFYPSPQRDDGYDISEYCSVHPDYGTMDDCRRFIEEAHAHGLRVITELIINHTSDQHAWFQRARNAPKGSAERDFYVWTDDDGEYAGARIIFTDTETSNWSWDPVAKQYYWHRFFSHQPDLNFDNPAVLDAVLEVMEFWMDLGVDGLRLDAIPYLIEREGTNCENLPETHEILKRIRAALDEKYDDRMLLAEANQWPEDVREYFADGDECHMAYHFPVMPRMYMAVAREDRHPIIDIMAQTPDIPANCQWAIFLRNHDELTLEMVTDSERDYMYSQYGYDQRMRINVGIRRRLAPLLENDTGKIKLMHSLLLSLLGTPVMYYGDEIGMGDNIYLGDRNGVRTPMQWSPDRNAGFSRADPQRLYLPPIMDASYGYEAVNVESQSRTPASLLNWMRRMITVRKQHVAFGRGTLRFLAPGNRKILAWLREYEDADGKHDTILCVANLARTPQPVELNLAEFEGAVPVELTGRTAFPPIGVLPYLLTLAGHECYWFGLTRDVEQPAWHTDALAASELPVIVVASGWQSFLNAQASGAKREGASKARHQLAARLVDFLPAQRWFAAKSEAVQGVELVRIERWDYAGGSWLLCWVEARFASIEPQQYFLPLSIAWDAEGTELLNVIGPSSIARVRQHARVGVLYDGFADGEFCRAASQAMVAGHVLPVEGGEVRFGATSSFGPLLEFDPQALAGDASDPAVSGASFASLHVEPSATQGSNSAIVLSRPEEPRDPDEEQSDVTVANDRNLRRVFLKGYRRLQTGANPEVEIGRHLTERSSFANVAPLAGSIDFVPSGAEAADDPSAEAVSLAVLQGYVLNQGDAWVYTTDYLERFLDTDLTAQRGLPPVDGQADFHGSFLESMRTLGRRTGEMHLALVDEDEPAFAPEKVGEETLTRWSDATRAAVDASLAKLGDALESMDDATRALGERLLARREDLVAAVDVTGRGDEALEGVIATRHHGDYHLGQVLIDRDDFIIIDFEGEPGRSPAERRARQSPLKDVAGMLRSFDYGAATALQQAIDYRSMSRDVVADALDIWQRRTRDAFLEGYRGAVDGSALWPSSGGDALLRLLMIDKALYELRYELDQRPDWVNVPMGGLLGLLGD